MQAELVEKLVHHKGGTSHIARIFHYGDEQKEYQDVRQERYNRSHASDDSVDDEVVEDTCWQQVAHHAAEPAHKHVEPLLRIGADGEGCLEHQPHKHQQHRQSQPTVGKQFIGTESLPAFGVVFVGHQSLFQRSAHKAVAGVAYLRVDGLFVVFLQLFAMMLGDVEDGLAVGQFAKFGSGVFHVLQRTDCQVSRRIFVDNVLVLLNLFLDGGDGILDVVAVVDMYVVGDVLFVLEHVDNGLQHFGDAVAFGGRGGHYRETEHGAESLVVELVAVGLKFVEHIESHHHRCVHVDKLGGEEQVAFEVRRIDDVQNQVVLVAAEVLAHAQLLGRIFVYRIGPRQVHQTYGVAFVVENARFDVHRNAAVVAHLLVQACGVVEKGGLAAVGVAHQCHGDGVAYLADFLRQQFVVVVLLHESAVELFLFGVRGDGRHIAVRQLDNVNFLCLAAAQRHPRLQYLVFDGVAQGGVLYHRQRLATHKAHLHQPVAQSPVTADFHNHALGTRRHIGQTSYFVFSFFAHNVYCCRHFAKNQLLTSLFIIYCTICLICKNNDSPNVGT